MHILHITPQLPYPPDSGVRVAMLNELQYLSRLHMITLLCFVTEDTEPFAQALTPFCGHVVTVRHKPVSSKPAMLANLFSAHPYNMVKFHSKAMMDQVARLTSSAALDLVHIDHLHMAQYITAMPPDMPVILRTHNVESVIMRRFADRSTNPLIRIYAGIQAGRLYRYEASLSARFDRCVAVTGVDGRTLEKMAPDARIEVVSYGVDTEWFDPSLFSVSPGATRLVTTGDYGWPPTADGLKFLVHDIFPRIRASIPAATLSVVGRHPPASVVHAADRDGGIDIRGRVEDVRPEILRGAVFVTPTRIGSGIRLKILEAMAMRRPVVSTTIGCEGIEAAPNEHLLVADDPDTFAACVVELIQNPEKRDRLTAAAAELVDRRYAWSVLVKQMDDVYRSVRYERSLKA